MVGKVIALMLLLAPALAHAEPAFKQYKTNYIVSEWTEEREQPWVIFGVSYQYSLEKSDSMGFLDMLPDGKLTVAYSQTSYWRAFDPSAPMDEHNFEPEIFYDMGSWKYGMTHLSTGMDGTKSRSMDRVFVEYTHERGRLSVSLRGWGIVQTDRETESMESVMSVDGIGGTGMITFESGDWYRHALVFTKAYAIGESSLRISRDSNLYLYARGFVGRGYSLKQHENEMQTVSVGVALIH